MHDVSLSTDARLGPTSFLVLGTLAVRGPTTPYELNRFVEISVGYFWSFPRAQLYREPARLAELGLVTEQREEHGRRRRVFTITDAGRRALGSWIAEPVDAHPELRDLALLKLFFTEGDPGDAARLAESQLRARRRRLTEYEAIQRRYEGDPALAHRLLALRMGVLLEEAAIAFWEHVAAHAGDLRSPDATG